jgi:hypothetical protein
LDRGRLEAGVPGQKEIGRIKARAKLSSFYTH